MRPRRFPASNVTRDPDDSCSCKTKATRRWPAPIDGREEFDLHSSYVRRVTPQRQKARPKSSPLPRIHGTPKTTDHVGQSSS